MSEKQGGQMYSNMEHLISLKTVRVLSHLKVIWQAGNAFH